MERTLENGQPRYAVYVNRINVCSADADDSEVLEGADLLAFAEQYIANDPRADLNTDESIDVADLSLFQTSYVCGCGTPVDNRGARMSLWGDSRRA